MEQSPPRPRSRVHVPWPKIIFFVLVIGCVILGIILGVRKKRRPMTCRLDGVNTQPPMYTRDEFLNMITPLVAQWREKKNLPTDGSVVALKTRGCQLMNGRGEPVVLYGISMTGLEYETPTPYFVSDQQFQIMRDMWKVNTVRVPFKCQNVGDVKDLIPFLDETIRLCVKYDMYIILDNHKINGLPTETDVEVIHKLMARYISLDMVMYELYNEMNDNNFFNRCDAYFVDVVLINISVRHMLQKLRAFSDLQGHSPVLIVSGLFFSSLWAFFNPEIRDTYGNPFCQKSFKDLLEGVDNIMISYHPYVHDTTVNSSSIVFGNNPNSIYQPDYTNRTLPTSMMKQVADQKCSYVDWSYTTPSRKQELIMMAGFAQNIEWILDQDIVPVILTEFGNLTDKAVYVNSDFIRFILRYISEQNQNKKGSIHFTAWAWINDKISYQSLLQDCQGTPKSADTCGDIPYFGTVVHDFLQTQTS